jgi:hypothetical protein
MPTTALVETLADMVFYAIDQGSPFPLALTPSSDSLAKIEDVSLPALMIGKDGAFIMWTIINAHLPRFGGRPVSAGNASACRTAGDVYRAAHQTVGDPR